MSKLTYPMHGWACFRWRADELLSPSVENAIRELADLPGVRGVVGPDECYIEVPRNLWLSTPFQHLVHSIAYVGLPRRPYVPMKRAAQDVGAAYWKPQQPLYSHQEHAVRFLVSNGGGLCGDVMGLGKTRVAIVSAMTLGDEDRARPKLILGPKYTRDVWLRELRATGAVSSDEEYFVCEGRSTERVPKGARWIFCHYDVVLAWQTRLGLARPIVAILDEAHWIKNGRAARSKGAAAAAGVAPYRILLTGTPMANRPAELWWPLTVLDGKGSWGTPSEFRVRYCGATHNGYGLQDGGPTRTDELRSRLELRYIRRTLDDAGVVLPTFTRRPLEVELSESALKHHGGLVASYGYQKLLNAIVERRAGEDTIALITKLRQITSEGKLDATVDFVRDALDQGESCVVFAWTRRSVAAIMDCFPPTKYIATEIHGGYAQDERDRRVARFQREGGVLVATLDSLKEGVTLTKARFVVMHDMAWVPSDMLQAEARVYRIGQTKPVQSVWVLAKDSIDILLAATLATKSDAQLETLGIHQAREAVVDLGLADFANALSVADEASRLVEEWMSRTTEGG